MDEDREQDNESIEIPVLQEIVEIHVGPEGQRVAIPLDLHQLATRITDELASQLHKELAPQLEACMNQAMDSVMAKIRREVQKVLLAQLGNSDS